MWGMPLEAASFRFCSFYTYHKNGIKIPIWKRNLQAPPMPQRPSFSKMPQSIWTDKELAIKRGHKISPEKFLHIWMEASEIQEYPDSAHYF
jgi:hypothetical protein